MVKSKSRGSSSGDDGKKSMKKEEVQYKGVRMRRWGSWVSEIRAPNQKTRIWLGSYSTQEAAARAYDAALLCLKGSSASFNFPSPLHADHRLHEIPPAAHLSTKSIQRLAAAAAAANATTSSSSSTTTTTTLSPSALAASSAISTDTSCNCTAASPAVLQGECVDSWFDSAFQPHKPCTELMMMMMLGGGCGAFFDPPLPQVEESCFDEVGDIRLWSFY